MLSGGALLCRLKMMLVTVIALTCVSCSLFPKKELSRSNDERPKAAQNILTTLNVINVNLDALYSSVARGLEESVLVDLDRFVVEAAAKKTDQKSQADLIKAGLEILVDLKVSKIDPAVFNESVRALRRANFLFDLSTLRYVQEAGRIVFPSALGLTSEAASVPNNLARGLFTLSAVVERTGIPLPDDEWPERPDTVVQRMKQNEEKLTKLKPENFLLLQAHLVVALNVTGAASDGLTFDERQFDFALAVFENALALATAMQSQKDLGQIDKGGMSEAFRTWSMAVKVVSEQTAAGADVPKLSPIPEQAPVLDSKDGSLPEGNAGWVFALSEKPSLGTVDLEKNPPVYTPSVIENFSIDRYSFRVCLKIVPNFCSVAFPVIVQNPLKPSSVTLKTTDGTTGMFVRGDELVCAANLDKAGHVPIYRWTLQGLRRTGGLGGQYQTKTFDLTSLQVFPGRLKIASARTPSERDVRDGDKITCEVKSKAPNGLESSFTSPTLATVTAANSAPSDLYLDEKKMTLEEQIGTEAVPSQAELTVLVDDMDGEDESDLGPYHLSEVTITDCDGIAVSQCPFEMAMPQLQTTGHLGYFIAKMKQVKTINFEAKSYYDLKLKAVDKGARQLEKVVRVTVLDRNDPVTGIAPTSGTIAENRTFTTTLKVLDQDCVLDAGCQTSGGYVYEVASTFDGNFFEIVGNELRSKAPLNYEQMLDDQLSVHSPDYTIEIQVTDASAISYPSQTFTLNVTNENEDPTAVELSNFLIAENSGNGVVLGQLTTLDPDQAGLGDTFSYVLTVLGDAPNFFAVSGNEVITTPQKINFEEHPTVSFLVTSTDFAGRSISQAFTVNVIDVNEAPTNISLSPMKIEHSRSLQGRDENNPTVVSVHSIVDIFAIDPDGEGETFTFEIVSTNGVAYDSADAAKHPFMIVGSTLQPKRVFDSATETNPYFTIGLKAKDQGLLSSSVIEINLNILEIRITNPSSPAKCTRNGVLVAGIAKPMTECTVDENITPPDTVGDFCVHEGASSNCVGWTYTLLAPPAGDFFSISGTALRTNKSINYEENSSFTLMIQATEAAGGRVIRQPVRVLVRDVNEQPTPIVFTPERPAEDSSDLNLYVLAGQSAGELIGELSTTDPDAGDYMDWSVSTNASSSPDHSFFELVPDPLDSKKVRLKIAKKLTPATGQTEFKISVRVIDSGDSIGGGAGGESTGLSRWRQLVFKVVSYPALALESPLGIAGRYNKGLHDLGMSGLEIDLRLVDVTGRAPCAVVEESESNPSSTPLGIYIFSLVNPPAPVLAEVGVTARLKEEGNGYKICTLSLMPNENAAGDAELELFVRSSTDVGTLDSLEKVTVPVTFWRKPELRCPSRISLPMDSSVSGTPCSVRFSDASAPVSRSSEVITVGPQCGLSWSANTITGVMTSTECVSTVTVSGVTNKFGAAIDFGTPTVTLVPKKFSTNGAVFTSALDASGHLFLGGAFTAVDPVPAVGVTSVASTTAARYAGCHVTEGFNGRVNTIVYDSVDDSFLVGGEFTRYREIPASRFIRLTCSGEPAGWFTNKGFNGAVHAIALASDRTILVGGSFSRYGSVSSNSLVRLEANGILKTSFTSFSPRTAPEDGVYALALAGTVPETVWVGGKFSAYESTEAFANLVRIRIDNGENELTSGAGLDDAVYSLASSSGSVVAGGAFSTPRASIAKFNMDGTLDSIFSSGSLFSDRIVRSVVISDAVLFVGATGVVGKVNAETGLALSAFGDSGLVSIAHSNTAETALPLSLVVANDSVFVGGRFDSVDGVARSNLAKLSALAGEVDPLFNAGPGLNDTVRALVSIRSGDALLLGGEFSALGGTATGRLARFSPEGEFDADLNGSLGTGFNRDVLALLPSGTDLYVGGSFTSLKGVAHNRLVRLRVALADGSTSVVDSSFVTDTLGGFDNDVRALASLGPGKLLVGGKFTTYRSVSAPALISLFTANGDRDSGFNIASGFTPSSGKSVQVNALAVTDQGGGAYSVYAGGEFSRYKDYFSPRLVKVNQAGNRDASFVVGTQGFNAAVHAILVTSSGVFVGGDFTNYKGATVSGLVRLNSTTAALESSVTLSGGGVRALASATGGNLWAGGSFIPTGGSFASPVILLNSDLVLDNSFMIDAALGSHNPTEFNSLLRGTLTNSDVYGVHTLSFSSQSPARVFVGGFFSLLNNGVAGHSVRLTTQGSEDFSP